MTLSAPAASASRYGARCTARSVGLVDVDDALVELLAPGAAVQDLEEVGRQVGVGERGVVGEARHRRPVPA